MRPFARLRRPDRLEHDADAMAARALTPVVAPQEPVQGRAAFGERALPSSGVGTTAFGERVLPPSGRPLEPGLRTDFERRFHHDFTQVRVHVDDDLAAHRSHPRLASRGRRHPCGLRAWRVSAAESIRTSTARARTRARRAVVTWRARRPAIEEGCQGHALLREGAAADECVVGSRVAGTAPLHRALRRSRSGARGRTAGATRRARKGPHRALPRGPPELDDGDDPSYAPDAARPTGARPSLPCVVLQALACRAEPRAGAPLLRRRDLAVGEHAARTAANVRPPVPANATSASSTRCARSSRRSLPSATVSMRRRSRKTPYG